MDAFVLKSSIYKLLPTVTYRYVNEKPLFISIEYLNRFINLLTESVSFIDELDIKQTWYDLLDLKKR